jgi:predicted acyltransferase
MNATLDRPPHDGSEPAAQPAAAAVNRAGPPRLAALDAFRGAVMLLMASSGFGAAEVAKRLPESGAWQWLALQTEHAAWAGCSLWDLIQPSFMFMVGTAVAWSVANRQERGQAFGGMFAHALWRALALVLLGVFLTSAWSARTEWVFTNVLAQIGLAYPFLFLLAFTNTRTLWTVSFTVLSVYWLAFALHPLPPQGFNWATLGIPEAWPHLAGFAAHWEKNFNFAAAVDRRFLNLFPREAAFAFSSGGYQTLNFVPSLVTMIFGLIAGRMLRKDLPVTRKVRQLVVAGLAGIAAGQAIELLGLCPIVKRIWTPSWTLFSAGWVALLLAAFVAVIEWQGRQLWASPFVIAGLNPIALYCMWQLMGGFVRDNLKRHFGPHVFDTFGAAYAPLAERSAVLLVFWLILLWLYRRKIFVRL